MDKHIINLWADIGSEDYWNEFLENNNSNGIFVPFEHRWPQPGFIGEEYFNMPVRVVVMGQNPRASNTERASASDAKMFSLIQKHSQQRSKESIDALFSMMRMFMRGIRYKPAWKPITAVEKHLGLDLDEIAYLNLIPLATSGDRIPLSFRKAYQLSTQKQLEVLSPDKIVVFGKGAHDRFVELDDDQYDVRHIQQRNFKDAPSVKEWLSS